MNKEKSLVDVLKEKLVDGVATFKFTKTDGTERVAKGTRCVGLIPTHSEKHINELANVAVMVSATLNNLEGTDSVGDTNLIELAPALAKAIKPFMKEEIREKVENTSIVNYYDIDAKGWRSFKVESLIEIM